MCEDSFVCEDSLVCDHSFVCEDSFVCDDSFVCEDSFKRCDSVGSLKTVETPFDYNSTCCTAVCDRIKKPHLALLYLTY